MEQSIIYIKATGTYRINLGYVSYPADRTEVEKHLAMLVLDRNCSISYAEDDKIKVWVPKQKD